MGDDYPAADATWSPVTAGESGTFAEPLVILPGQEVSFSVHGLPTTVVGVTLYDAASGEVFGALARDDDGELVRVDPTDAAIGAVLSPDGGRWLLRSEVEDS